MMGRTILSLVLTAVLAGGVVIDRIAVVVGKHCIKSSDIDRNLRLTEFLNSQPLDLSAAARHGAAERLIDQAIIGDEIARGDFARPTESDVDPLFAQLRQKRYGGSDTRFQQALSHYGLGEGQLRKRLLWQLQVLRFIDQRFRPAALVTDEDVRAYYDQHRTDLSRQYPHAASFEELEPRIRTTLEGERTNRDFEQWLERARQRAQIEFRQEAFQ